MIDIAVGVDANLHAISLQLGPSRRDVTQARGLMITVPTIGEPKIVASAAKLPSAETASLARRHRPPSQLDQRQRDARADHQRRPCSSPR